MKVFEETKMKGMKLKNRFWKSASWENLAASDGHLTEELISVYRELAEGGVGTIVTGYAYVTKDEQPNPGMMGIYDDSFMDEYRQLTEMVHSYDANIVLQLVYGGSLTFMNPPSRHILGASAVENERTGIKPSEMTKEDIRSLEEAFCKAALRAKKAGFDGVEIHAAHGYMMSQFLSPYYNRRQDEYGGTVENRARFLMEIIDRIRADAGSDFPIIVKLNSEDFSEGGLTEEESLSTARLLAAAGADAIDVSGGNESSNTVIAENKGPARSGISQVKGNESYFLGYAKKLSDLLKIPVILTGGNRRLEAAEEIVEGTRIAYISMARPLIREPALIRRWQEGDTRPALCVSCNGCYRTYGKRCVFNIKR